MSKVRTDIQHYIPCNCQSGGLGVYGIEFEYEDFPKSANVWIFNLHSPLHFIEQSFWSRLKHAFKYLFKGSDIYGADVVLSLESVTKLRDACQDALDRWPEYELLEGAMLEEIYQMMQDEEAGRKLRLKEEGVCPECGGYDNICNTEGCTGGE